MNKNVTGVVLLITFVLGGIFYLKYPTPIKYDTDKPTACAQDAKVCPDGSSVGRLSPNCEFAKCPTPLMEDGTIIPKETPEEVTGGNDPVSGEVIDGQTNTSTSTQISAPKKKI